MTEQLLKDALAGLADRAEHADDLADRALRTAARRRRAKTAAGAAALALAAAVPVTVVMGGDAEPQVLSPSGGAPDVTWTVDGLPDNTPAEDALTRACMRNQPSSGFRVLTRQRVPGGQLVEVGRANGYVFCVTDGSGNTEPPQVHPWPGKTGGGLFRFDAPLRVDGIRQVQAVKWDEVHAVVVGRAKPGVTRVDVAWDGGRTAKATVHNGFFIAQTPARSKPDHNATGAMSEGAMSTPTIRVETVTGYDAAGEAVHTWRPKVPTEEAGFVPEDCTDKLTRPRPTLCD